MSGSQQLGASENGQLLPPAVFDQRDRQRSAVAERGSHAPEASEMIPWTSEKHLTTETSRTRMEGQICALLSLAYYYSLAV